jgi:hypothetical protein
MENEPAAPTPPPLRESVAKPYFAGSGEPPKKGTGSGWILALAIMQVVGALIFYGMANIGQSDHAISGLMPAKMSTASLVVMLGLAAIYFGLWFWSKKALFAALLTTLIVFLTFVALDAVVEPLSLLRGIIIKIVVVAGLCTALKKAYVEKREREMGSSQS